MSAVLPEQLSFRRPTAGDAEEIFALVAARNTAVVGFADYTLDDMIDELAEPGLELGTDAWLVLEGNQPVGYATVFGKGDHRAVDLELVSTDRAAADWLLDQALPRAADLGRAHGHREISVDAGAYRTDEAQRALLAARGFLPGTTFHRMRIDHTASPQAPEIPPGITVRRGALDDATRRVAHAVLNAAFDGQFGFVPRPYDEWAAAHESRSTFDWSQLTLLELDGEPVAFRECTDEFVPDENCSYIGRLAVLPAARGRGLAKFLLRDAFAQDAAAGRTGTILHVDTNNPTPALGLYLSVGMRAVLAIDAWRLVLKTT
ncbi:GNAT family N-acetyltransferase [Kribbella italica]|uniref:Ribosomal protein S18 acetylase RimI-like enzyme n=1 Tax=Kribbella italica TaxID=1540520 RepID=A0A7W9J2N2_9ACTN|nr:GNAT family N-acetyltransferase [Kribbella italica]MBB5834517.1 ribosomal protein S18 acetylase RimI-like enzyme [Kribbella italica]